MKIKSIEIKYFKFHQSLSIDIESKNCLIYGENGTGKSSIYEALYSNFYSQKRLDKNISIQDIYKNRNFLSNDVVVNIHFDNNCTLNRTADHLEPFSNIEQNNTKPTILFANEKVLKRLTKQNFYIALKDTLAEHFPELKTLTNIYKPFENLNRLEIQIKEEINSDDDFEIRKEFDKRITEANNLFRSEFNNKINADEITSIIKNNFDEDINISFIINDAKSSNIDMLEFNIPEVKLIIDSFEHGDVLHHYFNEAKLKLISVAIYFSLAKKFEITDETSFKLLVLDDFLTSLDMSNRGLIVKYILENFVNYQKIIMTHNLQFYNLIQKLIENLKLEDDSWIFNSLYISKEENGFIANIKNKNINYLVDAETYFKQGEYQISGNFLRKEFESIAEELKQILELGKAEKLNSIIELIKNSDSNSIFYFRPLTIINFIYEKLKYLKEQIQNTEDNKEAQVGICKAKVDDIENKLLTENKKEQIDSLITIINKVEFYKNINFNSASHRERVEIYRKEIERGISLLKELKDILKQIRNEKY